MGWLGGPRRGRALLLGALVGCRPEAAAPAAPGCEVVARVPLAPDGAFGAAEALDTALAFSADGARLAVGTAGGEVLVVDASSGAVTARTRVAESLVRTLAFSRAGDVLWVAEQSADAFVSALDAGSLAVRAQVRLADHVASSPPPAADDPYGVYQLPAAYALVPRDDGSVIATATHGWDTPAGRRNASRVVRLGPDGAVVAAWPAEGAADVVLGAVASDADRVAVALRRSAAGPPPLLPIDGVLVLRADDLAPAGEIRVAPLPAFGSVFVWDALALQGPVAWVGTGDGRIVRAEGAEQRVLPLGAPLGAAPIAASVGTLRAVGDEIYAVTSRSWSPAAPDGPATIHPDERVLAALDGGLGVRWIHRGPHELAGLALTDAEVVSAAGARSDGRTDLFGLIRLPRAGDGTPRAVCPTEGPVHPGIAATPDGLVAGAIVPWVTDGVRQGPYALVVWR